MATRVINVRTNKAITQGAAQATSQNPNVALSLANNLTGLFSALPPGALLQAQQQAAMEASTVRGFGTYPNLPQQFPNDTIQLDVYNAVDQYLESNFRVQGFNIQSDTVSIDVEKSVADMGYISGKYRVVFRFFRNHLGSGDGHKLRIQEISADGLEIRVIPAFNEVDISLADFEKHFGGGFFALKKPQVLENLYLLKNATTTFRVFDYVQDKFTFRDSPHSIIFKLTSPVDSGTNIGDNLWLAQEINDPLTDTIIITPPKAKAKTTYIAGPNWDVLAKTQTTVSSQYKDWDDILTTNSQTSQDIVNKLLSGSYLEGIPLNIDYKKFENYVTFGSAVERLRNFKYKMELLEYYNARIAELTVDLNALPSSSVSSSLYFIKNVADTKIKKSALLGGLDGYEQYLYYESSSYESSSYGEFFPTTWPKSTTAKPHINYSTTSSQVENWYDGIEASASLYDTNNMKALYKLIPAHVLEDPANEEYVLLTNMMGHYFDLIYAYIKQITEVYNRDQSISTGFSKELIFHVAKNLGVDFENGNSLEDLWSYALGVDETGSYQSTYTGYGITSQDRTREIWKRIVNNLPFLLKTKGTERGLRALINCYGIPQTILRVREYGGAEPEFDSKTDLQYERFTYALQVGYGSETNIAYYGTASYGTGSYSSNDPTELISIPWATLLENNRKPMAIQLRFKMAEDQTKEQRIMEVPNQWLIKTFQSASGNYIGFFLSGSSGWATASVSSSVYDNTFHSLTLQRENFTDTASDNQVYSLIVKKVAYDKVVGTYTASLSVNGSLSSSYNTSFLTTGTLWIPGSGSFTFAQSQSMTLLTGSIQEFRYWTQTLQSAILDNHALAPTSYQGNTDEVSTGSTSSYYDLAFRLCLGTDNNKTNFGTTSSFNSQHPNQQKNYFDGSIAKQATFYRLRAPLYEYVTERHSLEWPDLGGNRSVSNKIRVDNTILASNQLYTDNRAERSLADFYPPDSPRLGIYLSPQNEINQDIAEQFGGLSIDDFIGDPGYLELETYPGLDQLKWEYGRKFTQGRNNTQNYIRLIRHFDASLFQLIKKFVPYRANTQVGLLIEPTIIERSKFPINKPVYEHLHYSTSVDVGPETFIALGGFVQDGDGEPFRNSPGYVPEGTFGGDESDYFRISGEEMRVREFNDAVYYYTGTSRARTYEAPREDINAVPAFEFDQTQYLSLENRVPVSMLPKVAGSQSITILEGDAVDMPPGPFGRLNEFNGSGIGDQLSNSDYGNSQAEVDVRTSQFGRDLTRFGSQYVFYSYYSSGSGAAQRQIPFTSSRYDYHEAIQPIVYTNTYSNRANVQVYSSDLYAGHAFGDPTFYRNTFVGTAFEENPSGYRTLFSSSAALYENNWTEYYGLSIKDTYTGSVSIGAFATTSYWGLTSSLAPFSKGLYFYHQLVGRYTGSATVPAFYYRANDVRTHSYIYRVSFEYEQTQAISNCFIRLYFGYLNSSSYQDFTLDAAAYARQSASFLTRAIGPDMGIQIYSVRTSGGGNSISIPKMSVECLNYRAQVQDFHLNDSYGMRNARYDGCKLTAADYNVDSPDTVDGGPVIKITTTSGNVLQVQSSPRGNLSSIGGGQITGTGAGPSSVSNQQSL